MEQLPAAQRDAADSPVAGMIVLSVIALAIVVWAVIIGRLVRREPLATTWPRRPVPWPWWLMVGAFLLHFLTTTVVASAATVATRGFEAKGVQLSLDMRLAVNSIAGITSTLLIILVFRAVAGASLKDLGLETRWLRSDMVLGLAGFLAVLPVVYFVKWLLAPYAETRHPIEQAMRNNPTPALMFWVVMAAVVAAPIVEEFLLRVVFQG